MASEKIKSDCKKEFENRLVAVRGELTTCLEKVEVLDNKKLEDFLNTFNHRLVIFQKDYMDYIADKLGHSKSITNNYKFESPDYSKLAETATAILSACGAAVLVHVFPVATTITTGWIFTKTVTVSVGLSSVIGTAIGVSAGIVTAGIGLAAGAGVGYAVNKALKKKHEKEIRNKIICLFDGEVTEKLRKWADEQINK